MPDSSSWTTWWKERWMSPCDNRHGRDVLREVNRRERSLFRKHGQAAALVHASIKSSHPINTAHDAKMMEYVADPAANLFQKLRTIILAAALLCTLSCPIATSTACVGSVSCRKNVHMPHSCMMIDKPLKSCSEQSFFPTIDRRALEVQQ